MSAHLSVLRIRLASGTSVLTHALEHVAWTPFVTSSTTILFATVLKDTLETLTQLVQEVSSFKILQIYFS